MLLILTYINTSQIHGTGLFAGAPIPKGTKIWQHVPELETSIDPALVPSYPPSVQHYIKRYSYPHPTRDGWWEIEGDNGRFINHSEIPNTNFTDPVAGYAHADIAEGEEITCNYGEYYPAFKSVWE
jgi:SET domain-containing protein